MIKIFFDSQTDNIKVLFLLQMYADRYRSGIGLLIQIYGGVFPKMSNDSFNAKTQACQSSQLLPRKRVSVIPNGQTIPLKAFIARLYDDEK